MVVRRRVRMVVLPLGLWTLSALVVGYFVWQAESGNRGLEAKKALKIRAYGHLRGRDELRIVEGSLEARKFTAVYRTGDRLTGVLSVGMPPKSTRAWRSSIALRARWQDAVPANSLGVPA